MKNKEQIQADIDQMTAALQNPMCKGEYRTAIKNGIASAKALLAQVKKNELSVSNQAQPASLPLTPNLNPILNPIPVQNPAPEKPRAQPQFEPEVQNGPDRQNLKSFLESESPFMYGANLNDDKEGDSTVQKTMSNGRVMNLTLGIAKARARQYFAHLLKTDDWQEGRLKTLQGTAMYKNLLIYLQAWAQLAEKGSIGFDQLATIYPNTGDATKESMLGLYNLVQSSMKQATPKEG
jgi:hypothetical protein